MNPFIGNNLLVYNIYIYISCTPCVRAHAVVVRNSCRCVSVYCLYKSHCNTSFQERSEVVYNNIPAYTHYTNVASSTIYHSETRQESVSVSNRKIEVVECYTYKRIYGFIESND